MDGTQQPQPQQRHTLLSLLDSDDVLFDDRMPTRERQVEGTPSAAAAATARRPTKDVSGGEGSTGALEPAFLGDTAVEESVTLPHPHKLVVGVEGTAESCADKGSCDDEALARAEVHALTTSELLQGVRLWPVIKRIYPMMLSCLLTFFVTYLIYPGILLVVDAEDGWYTTLIMAVYNFGDLIGRVSSMWKCLWPSRTVIVIGAVSRLAFIPLLVLCAVGKIPGHAPAYAFTAVFAISNGFFGTLSMVYATETPSLKTDGERAIAGQAVGVCLLLGCSLGSLIQLAEVLPFN